MSHRLLFCQRAPVFLLADGRMVRRQLLELAIPQQIKPRIPDVPQGDPVFLHHSER